MSTLTLPKKEDLGKFLQESLSTYPGLTMQIETQEVPLRLDGGVVEDVQVNSAWFGFCLRGKRYRTKGQEDLKNFLDWYRSEEKSPFSPKKGDSWRFGPPNVVFTEVKGSIPLTPVPMIPSKK